MHLDTSEGAFNFLIQGVVQEIGIEHTVALEGFLLLENGTQVLAGSADGAVYDTLLGAPYAPANTPVETIKIHIGSIAATALAIASIIFITAVFVVVIVEVIASAVLGTLLDSLQWAILYASIPWVYLTLYGDRNPDNSLTLFLPWDAYILPTLADEMLYVATSKSWWLLQKNSWWIFSWYSATWVCPAYQMPAVSPLSPVASFAWDPEMGISRQSITFRSTSYDPDGEIQSWHWYFGDGTEAYGENTTHMYTMPGSYDVRLVVTDNDGQSAETSTSLMGLPLLNVIPEVPLGTVAACLSMIVALSAFMFVRKRGITNMRRHRASIDESKIVQTAP